MMRKKIITAFLILVVMLQTLPVKQAVKYFLNDNFTAEEVLPVNKSEAKNFKAFGDDENFINDLNHQAHHFTESDNTGYLHFAEMLPDFHTKDIQTPPPNIV